MSAASNAGYGGHRVLGWTLTALVAGSLLAGAGATPALAASPTTMSGWTSRSLTVPVGYPVLTKVRIRTGGGYQSRIVKVQRRRSTAATWTTVATVTTSATGTAKLRYPVPAIGNWSYRLYVVPTGTAAGVLSATRPVKSIAGVRTILRGWSATGATARTGSTIVTPVAVTSGATRVARTVMLQRRPGNSRTWTSVRTLTTSSAGAATVAAPVPAPGTWYFRLVVVPSKTAAGMTTVGRPVRSLEATAWALASGDARGVSQVQVVQMFRQAVGTFGGDDLALRQAAFGLTADGSTQAGSLTGLDWNPTHDSMYFTIRDRLRNHPLLVSNWKWESAAASENRVMAVTGRDPATLTPYAAFGGTPLNGGGNAAFDQFMKNLIASLTTRSGATDFKVVLAQVPGTETYWFPYEEASRNWLATAYPGITINGLPGNTAANDACDGAKLAACLTGTDLLIVGDSVDGADPAVVMANVDAALRAKIPVVFFNHRRSANELAAPLMDRFGIDGVNNYWAGAEGLKAWDPASPPAAGASSMADIDSLITRLVDGTVTDRATQFDPIANALRDSVRQMDGAGQRLFQSPGYALEKTLVLLADKFRESVAYPVAADTPAFYRTLLSDRLVYMSRGSSTVATNLGDFSGVFPASTPTITSTVSTTIPANRDLTYATGLYALPGRPITLRRTDMTPTDLRVGVNILRNTTFRWGNYDRPDQLASARVPIAPGGTITITSPHGGPIYLFADHVDGLPTVSVEVANVITHPILRDGSDAAQVTKFKSDLAATATNWAIMDSPYLMVTSTKSMMNSTVANWKGDVASMYAASGKYLVKDAYELAGFNAFNGTDFTLAPTVASFCQTAGWDCTSATHRITRLQHMVADRPICGDGCSGNPIDFDWAFDPLGWGESHELGHNLQRGRMKIYDGASTEVSNNMFALHKLIHYNLDRGLTSTGTQGKAMFDLLVAAQGTADPVGSAKSAIWQGGGDRLMFYRQLVEYARHYNASFGDGWEMWTLMYMMDRQLDAAKATWPASAATLGFGTYATFPSLGANDFMLISSSRIIGRDMRPMFDLYGITYSPEADAQVAAYGTTPVQQLFFPMANKVSFGAQVGAPVLVTPSAGYPTGY